MTTNSIDKYNQAFDERRRHVQLIIQSDSLKKVVVAGPGTGKTYLFKEVLHGKKNTLTLSFVNSLVEDLSLELYGLSNVRTLHSFSRSILGSILKKDIKISPLLSKIIREDAKILLGENIYYDKIFYELDRKNEFLKFYETRRLYYDYYGYSDIVFTAVKHFEDDKEKIPVYDQILVDEFQDFNKLEVTLIDLLAEKSPVLLAGDDDQALYEFKSASPSHIRDRHGNEMPEYATFNLPFCARCPKVVVEATSDLIDSAKQNGLLNGRIDKPFEYFIDKKKDKISDRYPNIGHAKVYANQIPWMIEKCIAQMALDIKDNFTVLIISPFKKQSHAIAVALKEKGLDNIEYSKKLNDSEITILDGFKLLIQNNKDNLGWRIVSRFILKDDDFVSLVKNSNMDPSKNIYEYLPSDEVKGVKTILKALKYINTDKTVNPELLAATFKRFDIDPNIIASNFLNEKINSSTHRMGNLAIRRIPIKSTTIQSSKGLAGDVVFITHFDDRYFIANQDKKRISDRDFCNFLVALTRTKKKVFLISTVDTKPTFLKWIASDKIQKIS